MMNTRRCGGAALAVAAIFAATGATARPGSESQPALRTAAFQSSTEASTALAADADAELAADFVDAPPPPRVTRLQSWTMGPNMEIAIGRFAVTEVARPRTNVERERDPLVMRSRPPSIAGAGFSLHF